MSVGTRFLPAAVHDYLVAHSVHETPGQSALRAHTARLPHATMQISPEQGQFMQVLVRLIGARRAIEVGTFTGYSALCVALALPAEGRLVCCDVSEEYTAVGRPYWKQAGVAQKIDLRIAPATDTLDALLAGGEAGSYDFAFIDADKPNYLAYYERCLKLLRAGGALGIDNTLWSGAVADAKDQNESTRALREVNDKVFGDARVEAAMLPIGDGFTLVRKK